MAPLLALPLVLGMPGTGQASGPAAVRVGVCGLEFELPAGYKITRPKRIASVGESRGCSFDVVRSRPEPAPRGDCKNKEEGGSPPYDRCDWRVDNGPMSPSVQVVRMLSGDRSRTMSSFWRADDGHWMVPNAQAGNQVAEAIDYCGKSAWRGDAVVRLGWSRAHTKDYPGIYAGSGSTEVTWVQLAPDLFVQLNNPPIDDQSGFSVFCASLRLGTRKQDLP